jgi:hypothetical protein
MAFKNHGCGRHFLAALDAVVVQQRESGFGPDDVEAVPGAAIVPLGRSATGPMR